MPTALPRVRAVATCRSWLITRCGVCLRHAICPAPIVVCFPKTDPARMLVSWNVKARRADHEEIPVHAAPDHPWPRFATEMELPNVPRAMSNKCEW